jgi:hypothetical protein
VVLANPYRPRGISVNDKGGYPNNLHDDGMLHGNPGHQATATSYGKVYLVTLPTGEEIEVWDGQDHGIELAHHQRVRFRTRQHDAASLERVRSQLQAMGVSMKEAQEHDLELYYWRHLGGVLANRYDGKGQSSTLGSSTKYLPVWEALQSGMASAGLKTVSDVEHQEQNVHTLMHANLSPEQELDIWKAAWAKLTSASQVAKWVERGGHLPQFARRNPASPDAVAGAPFWYRFDMTPEFLANQQLLSHKFSNDAYNMPVNVALHSGGILSHEERMRMLGIEAESGMGNPVSSGGTHAVYMRFNQEHQGNVLLSPKLMAKTTGYAYNYDGFGKTENKGKLGSSYHSGPVGSPFDPKVFSKFSNSSNELMVNDAATLMDDIELMRAADSAQREFIIQELKSRGITSIRGLPVEDRIVLKFGDSEVKKIHDHYQENPQLLDPLFVLSLEQAAEQSAQLSGITLDELLAGAH